MPQIPEREPLGKTKRDIAEEYARKREEGILDDPSKPSEEQTNFPFKSTAADALAKGDTDEADHGTLELIAPAADLGSLVLLGYDGEDEELRLRTDTGLEESPFKF